jgi:hypothetical protein
LALPLRADKAGVTESSQSAIFITFSGLRDENAASNCLSALNRYRRRKLSLPEKGDGEYQIIVEKKRPGYLVRVEKQGTTLKTARALYDYEICIAAAAVAREAIGDN